MRNQASQARYLAGYHLPQIVAGVVLFGIRLKWRMVYGWTEAVVGVTVAGHRVNNAGGTKPIRRERVFRTVADRLRCAAQLMLKCRANFDRESW